MSLGIRCQRQAGGRCGQECLFVEGGHWHSGAPWSSQQLLHPPPPPTPNTLAHTFGAYNSVVNKLYCRKGTHFIKNLKHED